MQNYFAFQWHITDKCDQRCKHCYIFSDNIEKSLVETNYDDMKYIFYNCLNMCNKLNRKPYFYITGGDPILHPDFWKLLELFKENNVKFGILGNPFHLNQKICDKLKEYGCDRYQLSIDGLEETHDYFRKKGSYKTTLEKIDYIKKAGIKSVIMTTVSSINIKEIPSIIDTIVNKADIFAFARYCPTGNDKSNHIKPEEYKNLLENCFNKFNEYKDSNTSFTLKDHLWTLFLYEKGIFKIPNNLDDDLIYDGCNCGNSHLTILPNGDIYACRRMESKIGNILKKETNIENIFLSEEADKYRNFDKFSCSDCELFQFCRGCPAVSYGYTNNMYSKDPQCWKKLSIKEQ
ncbi:MAG: radical SAM/SPASM domain protein, ACGX system [Methanobacteriaceae archaeon]|nr:radical SAM/SPASM domain protein, ACGX system [Methanobacteriaceae archaeon]